MDAGFVKRKKEEFRLKLRAKKMQDFFRAKRL